MDLQWLASMQLQSLYIEFMPLTSENIVLGIIELCVLNIHLYVTGGLPKNPVISIS